MTNSPYRQASRGQIEIGVEPNTMFFLWSAWVVSAILLVITIAVGEVPPARILFPLAAAGACTVTAVLYRAARRVRWSFTLDGGVLYIERKSRISTENFVMNVRSGVSLGLGVAESTRRVDHCIVSDGRTRVSLTPGARPIAAYDRLVEFFDEHGVSVGKLS